MYRASSSRELPSFLTRSRGWSLRRTSSAGDGGGATVFSFHWLLPLGLAQSRLARVDAAFQRALNKIEAPRVTLGGSGISSSDVAGWLRRQDVRHLAGLAAGVLAPAPELTLLAGGHELLDRAELTLSDEARQIEADTALPPFEAAPSRAESSRRPVSSSRPFFLAS